MKYLPKNTLAYFNSAPQFHRHDLSEMPVNVFSQATGIYRKDCGEVFPNDEALNFYAINHCAAIVRRSFTLNEPLPEWAKLVMNNYLALTTLQGKRMLHYILSICTREMRHIYSMSPEWYTKLEGASDAKVSDFIQKLSNYNETKAVQMYMENPPESSVGKYITGLAWAFDKAKWSSGYGGKKWGQVAHACESFIKGNTSMEMLVDTGYTLAHNGGPIFNKGMMYTHYDGYFMLILDVQRSGQIPELILDESQKYGLKKTDLAKEIVKEVIKNKPEIFRGWVDWSTVTKLGEGVGAYSNYHDKQKQLHPVTVEEKKAVEKFFQGKKINVLGEWQVYPGESVTQFERVGV